MEKKIFIVMADWRCDGEPDNSVLGATFSLDKAREIMAEDKDEVIADWDIDERNLDWEIVETDNSYEAINFHRDEWYSVCIIEQPIV